MSVDDRLCLWLGLKGSASGSVFGQCDLFSLSFSESLCVCAVCVCVGIAVQIERTKDVHINDVTTH